MDSYTDKVSKKTHQSAANSISQKTNYSNKTPFQFKDNRPRSITQRKLLDMMESHSQTKQLKPKVNINDDEGLEKEADEMGAKSLDTNSSDLELKSNIEINQPTIQGKFSPSLNLKDADDLKMRLKTAGYTINKNIQFNIWFGNESENERTLNDIHNIANAIISDNKSIISVSEDESDLMHEEESSNSKIDSKEVKEEKPSMSFIPEDEKKEPEIDAKEKKVEVLSEELEKPKSSEDVIKKISLVSKEANEEAKEEIDSKKDDDTSTTIHIKKSDEEESGKEKLEEKVSEEKETKQEEIDSSALIINYVWLGDRKLGPLEKFNIYSWRTLGHQVNIYTLRFDGKKSNDASLGIESGDAHVIDLKTQLGRDEEESSSKESKESSSKESSESSSKNSGKSTEESPKVILGDARQILASWIGAIPKDKDPTKDHIFNMVDLTKSYIGGTQQGIVLDMKVGPSKHLDDYRESFDNNLISYTRGGNTFGDLPENQSIGTMQESEELRTLYAINFNKKIVALAKADPSKEALFNQITGYHGRSYKATKKWLDVATKTPEGNSSDGAYKVSEPGGWGHGPFRVFKNANDQSNKSVGGTKKRDVKFLAQEALKEELPSGIINDQGTDFYKKAGAAFSDLPKE